jgi:CBS domain-containing protein
MYRFLACTVNQYMTRTVKTVTRQTTMRELETLHDFNAFPMVEGGKMLGIVSKFDFLRAFAFTSSQIVPHYYELMGQPVADVMTEAVVHVDPTSPLTRVLQLMVSLKTRSLPVMNADHQLEGMISREDVMRALKETPRQVRSARRGVRRCLLVALQIRPRSGYESKAIWNLNPLSPRRNPAPECGRPRTL